MARARKARLIGAPPPIAVQRSLDRELVRMVRSIRATLPRVTSPSAADALGRSLRAHWSDEKLRKILEAAGSRAEIVASKPWMQFDRRTDAKKPIKYNGQKLVNTWLDETLERVTSLRDDVSRSLKSDLVEALEQGKSPSDLVEKWMTRGISVSFGTLEGRLKVIAQNSLSTLHAEVQRTRATVVGVEEFFWRNQGDDAVRTRHVELGDTKWRYDKPPSDEGLPGTPVNCRCWAESVITDEMLGGLGISGLVET